MERSTASQLAFGRKARELNARALETRIAESDSRWGFAFAPGGLPSEARDALLALPGTRLQADQLWITGSALERLANQDTTAACFLQARRNLERQPSRPKIMGVLNVTPDSFSDGGLYLSPAAAIERAQALIAEGADLIDIGGESTRPGSRPVTAELELERVLPVIEALARDAQVPLSIDTTKSVVAERALDAGCEFVNDISGGLFDARILTVTAEHGATYVCMHTLGPPETMQQGASYEDPTAEICCALRNRVDACLNAGLASHKIVIDPGIGFGKRLADNLDLLRRLSELRSLGLPLLVGVSRKSFIGQLAADSGVKTSSAQDRLGGTAAAVSACVAGGAEFLRVHDVATMSEAARVAYAIHNPTP